MSMLGLNLSSADLSCSAASNDNMKKFIVVNSYDCCLFNKHEFMVSHITVVCSVYVTMTTENYSPVGLQMLNQYEDTSNMQLFETSVNIIYNCMVTIATDIVLHATTSTIDSSWDDLGRSSPTCRCCVSLQRE